MLFILIVYSQFLTDCGIKVGYMKRPSSDNEFKVSKVRKPRATFPVHVSLVFTNYCVRVSRFLVCFSSLCFLVSALGLIEA